MRLFNKYPSLMIKNPSRKDILLKNDFQAIPRAASEQTRITVRTRTSATVKIWNEAIRSFKFTKRDRKKLARMLIRILEDNANNADPGFQSFSSFRTAIKASLKFPHCQSTSFSFSRVFVSNSFFAVISPSTWLEHLYERP